MKTDRMSVYLKEADLISLLPASCRLAWRYMGEPTPDLHADEKIAVNTAVERRRHEFAVGRAAARDALAQIGIVDAVIPAGPNRVPLWPAGTVGSLTHNGEVAVAAVAHASTIVSIGIDIEASGSLVESLWRQVLVDREIGFVRTQGEAARQTATAIFSIKEAFYKYQYPHTGEWVDFTDAEVTLDLGGRSFELATRREFTIAGAVSNRFHGRVFINEAFTFAALATAR